MAQLLVAHPHFESANLSSLALCTLGSAPLAPKTLLRLQDKMPDAVVMNSYGMTEGGQAVFSMDPEGARTKPAAVGKPAAGVEVRVLDDGGEPVPTGIVGEIVTRNPNGHREYYMNPEATASMWAGGWLHTGDLGYLDEDGYLYVVGRKKDMIIRGGHNIYPDDVEAVAQAHPAVREAAVVGVPHQTLGEDVAVFIAIREGAVIDKDEFRSFCAERLADYKVPRVVRFVDELPRNAAGKVLKRELQELG
jgi:long-chain acyl-CoA synthetase